MDVEQAKKMVGTEFTYYFEDGDSVPAYVKAFDPAIGLTCMSLETATKSGWAPPKKNQEPDGTFCTNACNIKMGHHTLEQALRKLDKIATGELHENPSFLGSFGGCAF